MLRKTSGIWFILLYVLFTFAAYAQETSSFVPRAYYEAKLEPVDKVLHGAGQSPDAFAEYNKIMGGEKLPIVYMTYVGAKSNMMRWVVRLTEQLERFPDSEPFIQVGLSMTTDGEPELHYEQDVAAGKYDDMLTGAFYELAKLNRPVYFRIGYECNGSWNGYEPETYKQAFIHVTKLIRGSGLNATTVWCVDAHDFERSMGYYPGDEWVDWFGVDIFRLPQFEAAIPFLDEAERHNKPVMIGESTPHTVGVLDGQKSWDAWFEPYFGLIRNRPGIKAFCYINWNWTQYPYWAHWGDARLESNETVANNYRREMDSPLYLHASGRQDFLRMHGKADKTAP